jgi:hypothetical protein
MRRKPVPASAYRLMTREFCLTHRVHIVKWLFVACPFEANCRGVEDIAREVGLVANGSQLGVMVRNWDFSCEWFATGTLFMQWVYWRVVYAQSGQKVALPARSRYYLLGRAAPSNTNRLRADVISAAHMLTY